MLLRNFIISIAAVSALSAQVPAVMQYQGFVLTNGVAYTGNAELVFQIYDAPTGGFLLWTSTNSVNPAAETIAVSGGVYNYLLGSKNALTNMLWTGNGTFLQVIYKVASGVWTTNASRIQFLAVPYAFAAVRSLDSNPVGTVLAFYGNETHLMNMYNNRYLVCNGDTIGKPGSGAARASDQYRELYALIYQVNGNATYAAATNAWESGQTIKLPDMRGRFLRGMDSNSGRDPDASLRTDEGGTIVGDKTGSVQGDAFQDHFHRFDTQQDDGSYFSGLPSAGNKGFIRDNGGTYFWDTTWASTAAAHYGYSWIRTSGETRPKNISVNYIIKY